MALRNREKAGIQTLRNYSVTRHLTESGVSVAQYLSADFSTIIGNFYISWRLHQSKKGKALGRSSAALKVGHFYSLHACLIRSSLIEWLYCAHSAQTLTTRTHIHLVSSRTQRYKAGPVVGVGRSLGWPWSLGPSTSFGRETVGSSLDRFPSGEFPHLLIQISSRCAGLYRWCLSSRSSERDEMDLFHEAG